MKTLGYCMPIVTINSNNHNELDRWCPKFRIVVLDTISYYVEISGLKTCAHHRLWRVLDCYAFTPSTTPSILDAGYHVCRYVHPAPSSRPAYSSRVLFFPVDMMSTWISNSLEKWGVSGPGTTPSMINARPCGGAAWCMVERIWTHSASLQPCRMRFTI